MAKRERDPSNMDLTPAQRQAILDRDGHQCQSQLHSRVVEGKGRVHGADKLEVDHVIQKRYAFRVLGWGIWEINDPNNLLTKCQVCHTGHPDSHHPDTLEAHEKFRSGNRQAFREMVINRDLLTEAGEDYCNNRDREQDLIQAELNTQQADQQNPGWWRWPRRNRH